MAKRIAWHNSPFYFLFPKPSQIIRCWNQGPVEHSILFFLSETWKWWVFYTHLYTVLLSSPKKKKKLTMHAFNDELGFESDLMKSFVFFDFLEITIWYFTFDWVKLFQNANHYKKKKIKDRKKWWSDHKR